MFNISRHGTARLLWTVVAASTLVTGMLASSGAASVAAGLPSRTASGESPDQYATKKALALAAPQAPTLTFSQMFAAGNFDTPEWLVTSKISVSPTQVATIKAATTRGVLVDANADDFPSGPSATRSLRLANPKMLSDRQVTLESVWSRSAAASHVDAAKADLDVFKRDLRVESYDTVDVSLSNWVRIQVSGSSAFVVVNGTSRRHVTSGWIDEGLKQWQVKMVREGGAWKLSELRVLKSEDHDTTGAEEGMSVRFAAIANKTISSKMFAVSPATTGSYNASAAVTYADRYSCNPPNQCRNSSYQSIGGTDCTNFISQALRAGGVALSGDWTPYTYDWVNVSGLELMVNERNFSAGYQLQDKTSSYNNTSKGDGLVYDWGKGEGPSHRSLEAGFGARPSLYSSDGSGDYVDQHSTDRYHSPWNYGYLHPDSSISPANMKIYKEHFYSSYSY